MKSGVGAGSLDRLPAAVELDLEDTPAPTVMLRVGLGPSSYIGNIEKFHKHLINQAMLL